jgi:hypothetical protein
MYPSSIASSQSQPAKGSAFLPCLRRSVDLIFSQHFNPTLDRENTVGFNRSGPAIKPAEWRPTIGLPCAKTSEVQFDFVPQKSGHEGRVSPPLR